MPYTVVTLPSLTLLSGASTSSVLKDIGDFYALQIVGSTVMTSTSCNIQVENTSSGTTFFTLQSAGVDVEIFANKVCVLHPITFKQVRIVSPGAEGQNDTFRAAASMQV